MKKGVEVFSFFIDMLESLGRCWNQPPGVRSVGLAPVPPPGAELVPSEGSPPSTWVSPKLGI